jgi:aldose 1-epimerase
MKTMKNLLAIGLAAAMLHSCGNEPTTKLTLSGLDPARFQAEVEGSPVALYTLTNPSGMEVCITNFGGRVVSVMVPDRDGAMRDVVLGFDNIDDYVNVTNNFGAAIGRYGNRIGGGLLTIDGETRQLPQNNGRHTLHGGARGWHTRVFDVTGTTGNSLELTYVSPDGDENFPGTVTAKVLYTLTDDNALDIKYSATTDKKTVVNLTNHSYFNLSGDPSKAATDHIMWLGADNYTPVDNTLITTGEIAPVAGTPMDFTTPKAISRDIDNYDFEQLKNGTGYDHNWVLNAAGDIKQVSARLTSPASGIVMEMYTNEPGVQVYTGNFLDGSAIGKGGIAYPFRASVCLETQKYPDSPNKPEWPSALLEPGQTYNSECIYKFSVER